jgi:hypothetical protein
MATAEEIKASLVNTEASQNPPPVAPVASLPTPAEIEAAKPAPSRIKTYFTQHPNSNIHVMRGPGICETIAFVGNRLDTDDEEVIKHLEPIVNRVGSGIYTNRDAALSVSTETREMLKDVTASAAAAHAKMVAAGEKVA